MKLVLASNNAGKLREFSALLEPFDFELVGQRELGIADVEEHAVTFVENALAKARHASRVAGLPAIADDSGLVVPALGGEPGVRSARYSGFHGDDAANNRRLLERLADVTDRRACFYCVLVLLHAAEDPVPLIASASWWGEIARAPRGAHGFGYDPLFLVPGRNATSAELEPDEKNRLSHRARALAKLLEALRQEAL